MFHIDDMDFSHYDNPQLAYLCDHRVFVRSRFPKLVFALMHHPRFVEWITSAPDVTCASEADKVACVVDAVQAYSTDANGKIKHTTVRLDDATFWQMLVDKCWQYKPLADTDTTSDTHSTKVEGTRGDAAVADHERRVLHRVQRTLKPYRYWKTTTPDDQVVQRGGGGGGGERNGSESGKRGGLSNTTRKKLRSIWID